ncbi:MAG: hypothetical protein JHD16_05400 [Solirubrobacteraceae bacterium]|nr:hypothetical protein [Solirubrobacteraceae bacterium]
MSLLGLLGRVGARAACVALAGFCITAVAAPAAQAGPPQFQFSLAGGSRFTLTVGPAQQVPGFPARAKGYHPLCKESGPRIRMRTNFSTIGDTALYGERAFISKVSTPWAITPFGIGANSVPVITTGAPSTVVGPGSVARFAEAGSDPLKQPLAPAPGLYNLTLLYDSSFSEYDPLRWLAGLGLAMSVINAKLDFRIGSAAECPPATEQLSIYFRAR